MSSESECRTALEVDSVLGVPALDNSGCRGGLNLLMPIGSMYAIYIYGNMDPINIPQMLAYIPAPWIRHGYAQYTNHHLDCFDLS